MRAHLPRGAFLLLCLIGIVTFAAERRWGQVPEFPAERIGALGGWALPLLTSTAAIGFLAMCILQLLKRLFPMRASFQRQIVVRWIADSIKSDSGSAPQDVKRLLATLCFPCDPEELLDLPIEHVCGQFAARSETVLAAPLEHTDLLAVLLGRPETTDPYSEKVLVPTIDSERQIKSAQRIQRHIEALQIKVGTEWRRYLWTLSVFISGALGIIGVLLFGQARGLLLSSLFFIGFSAVFGGVVATIVRDVVAAIERGRT